MPVQNKSGNILKAPRIYIYIYIYIYVCVCVCVCVCVFFSPVKLESGIIPSGQLNYSNFERLNLPGKELNVTDITEQQFL